MHACIAAHAHLLQRLIQLPRLAKDEHEDPQHTRVVRKGCHRLPHQTNGGLKVPCGGVVLGEVDGGGPVLRLDLERTVR